MLYIKRRENLLKPASLYDKYLIFNLVLHNCLIASLWRENWHKLYICLVQHSSVDNDLWGQVVKLCLLEGI